MNRCRLPDPLQPTMLLQLKLKKCHLEEREVSRRHPTHSNHSHLTNSMLIIRLTEKHGGVMESMTHLFSTITKLLVCDFPHLPFKLLISTTGCQNTFYFATWMISFGAVIPVLRTTALMSALNTIFKGSLM